MPPAYTTCRAWISKAQINESRLTGSRFAYSNSVKGKFVMKYTHIKGVETPVSRLFIGTAWPSLDDEKLLFELFDRFFELGGNTIDTARFYGKGNGVAKAEVLVGKWVEQCGKKRSEIHIQNKCCHPFISRDGVMHHERWRVSSAFITEDLLYSLDRMHLDYFDIYQLHRDDENIPVSELIDTLETHFRAGLIKAYGVSNWQLPRIQEAMDYCAEMGYHGLSTSNPSYSLATVHKTRWPGCVYADDEFAHWHKDKDISFLSWGAQAAGFFAGVFDGENAPLDAREAFFTNENLEKRRRAEALAFKKGVTATNIALAYVLNQGFDICAIIGPRSIAELESCIRAEELTLSEAEIEYLSLRR